MPQRPHPDPAPASFREIVALVRPYRRKAALGLAILVAANGLAATIPRILQEAIDGLRQTAGRGLLGWVVTLLAVTGLIGLLRYASRRTVVGIARDIEYGMRTRLFAHLVATPPLELRRFRSGDILARATQDIGLVRMFIGSGLGFAANTVLVAVMAVTMMARLDPWLAAWALAPYPLLALLLGRCRRALHDRYEGTQEAYARISEQVEEMLSGIRVLKAYVAEASRIRRFEVVQAAYVAETRRVIHLESIATPLTTLVGGVGMVVALWLGGRRVIQGSLTLGQFVAFTGYLAMLLIPLNVMGWVLNLVERGRVSYGRLRALLGEPLGQAAASTTAGPSLIKGEIEVEDVTYRYPDAPRPALSAVRLRIAAGTTVALVGPIGSGKSTLLGMLPALWEPQAGRIRLDGEDLRDVPRPALRDAIGFVAQDAFLFSDSIRANVALGRPDATTEEIESAVGAADLSKDLTAFAEGLDAVVGERGVTLSGGQRQRVAIARAVLRRPGILVLDDALSSVDAETEARILRRVREALPAATILLATHRLATARHADRIAVLEDGRLVEHGTHDQLLAAGGLYSRLWEWQRLEEALSSQLSALSPCEGE